MGFMNPKTFLSKTTSVLASLALAIGGSLISTQPASATPAVFVSSLEGSAALSIFWNDCSSLSGTPSTNDFSVYKNNSQTALTLSSTSIPSGGSNNILLLMLPSAATLNDVYKIVFDNTSTGLICGASGSTKPVSILSSDNVTATTQPANQQQASYTMNTAPSFTVANGIATANDGSFTGTGGTLVRWWVICDSAKTASTSTPAMDCYPIYPALTGGAMERGTTLTLQETYYKPAGSNPRVAMNLADKYLLLYVAIGGANATTATVAGSTLGFSSGNQQQSTAQVTRDVERVISTPAFQAPILNSLAPKMTGGFSSNGGRLVLKDVKPADITSVMLNGKKVEVVASKSGAALRIPAGAGAGDLQFTMADGTVINVANAVKITQSQVDPKLVDLNPLPTFKAGSVVVPAAIKSALNKRKAIILDSDIAKCVGYASSNTASARATALTRAANVCGVITDINENIEPIVKVVVSKTIAKKTPVKYQTW